MHEHIQESFLLGGDQREILLGVFTRFCRFSTGAFCRISPVSMGRDSRSQPGKLLNLM